MFIKIILATIDTVISQNIGVSSGNILCNAAMKDRSIVSTARRRLAHTECIQEVHTHDVHQVRDEEVMTIRYVGHVIVWAAQYRRVIHLYVTAKPKGGLDLLGG